MWLSIRSSHITQSLDLMDSGFICGDVINAAVLFAEMSSDLICNGGKQSGPSWRARDGGGGGGGFGLGV